MPNKCGEEEAVEFEQEGSLLKCKQCATSVRSDEESRLHVLAHTTNCCLSCSFDDGALDKCSRHSSGLQQAPLRQRHRISLVRVGIGATLSHYYACLDCNLVTTKETDPNVIQKYLFCDECHFSSTSTELMRLHALKHSEHKVVFSCPVCLQVRQLSAHPLITL
jgi:hypothetical protein